MVIQYSGAWKQGDPSIQQHPAYIGNSYKSMAVSVEGSLKKLRTTYIDILYIHFWDWSSSMEEVMTGLHTLHAQGKILYLVSPEFHSVAID